jgi:hypothetical protein
MAGFRYAERHGLPLVLTWHTDLLAYAEHFVEIPVGAACCAAHLRLGWQRGDRAAAAPRPPHSAAPRHSTADAATTPQHRRRGHHAAAPPTRRHAAGPR